MNKKSSQGQRRLIDKAEIVLVLLVIATSFIVGCAGKGDTEGQSAFVHEYYNLWNKKTEISKMLSMYSPEVIGQGDELKKFKSQLFLMVQRYEVVSVETEKPIVDGNSCYVPVKVQMRLGGHMHESSPEDQAETKIFKLIKSEEGWLIEDTDYKGPMPSS